MKPRIGICTDSAAIDTGFGRVAREIGSALQLSGNYEVHQLGWFHQPNDKLLPFRISTTEQAPAVAMADKYGELTYEGFVHRFRPDLVIAIGDEWMVSHMARRPRNFKLVGYVPIDSAPMMPSWVNTFRAFDQFVAYGEFGELVVKQTRGGANLPIAKIPHGVDTNIFRRLSDEERKVARLLIAPDHSRFIVGCVARNNTRKQLPRLLKAFRQFINPWTSCLDCGIVSHTVADKCGHCQSTNLQRGAMKKDAMLYLHCVHNDPAGHQIIPLIEQFQLNGHVGIPDNMRIGRGVPDEQLNLYYNAFDFFALPTSGEGWGLPIMEAMAAGCPVLVTDYSAHVEFVRDAGEFINVAEWDTCSSNNAERALVDIDDFTMKMDRFYYERESFIKKWGKYIVACGFPEERLETLDCGKVYRDGLGKLGEARAQQYRWSDVTKMWADLIDKILGISRSGNAVIAAQPFQLSKMEII